MKQGLICLILLTVASGAAIGLRPRLQAWTTPTPTITEASSRIQTVFAVGIVEGRSSSVGTRFETAGRVTEVHVEEGDRIEAGQRLASLDTQELQYRRDLAQAKLDHAVARLAAANHSHEEELNMAQARLDAKQAVLAREEKTLGRFDTLLENRAISLQKHDDQLATVDVMRAETRSLEAELQLLGSPSKPSEIQALHAMLAAAESELRLADLELQRGHLVAATSGVILNVNIQVGEWVSRQSALPAVVSVDDSQLRIKAFVEEADASLVDAGQPVQIRKRSGDDSQPLTGHVTRLGPQFDMKQVMNRRSDERFDVRTRECWIAPSSQSDLVLGAHVDILIELDRQRSPQL